MYIIIEGPEDSNLDDITNNKISSIKSELPTKVLKRNQSMIGFKVLLPNFLRTGNPGRLINWYHRFYNDVVVPTQLEYTVLLSGFFPSLTAKQGVDPKIILERDWGNPLYVFLPGTTNPKSVEQMKGYNLFLKALQDIETGLTL